MEMCWGDLARPCLACVRVISTDFTSNSPSFQKEDDVHFLKKEIEKYRLELKNREVNFNRVFAEKTPLIIKKPAEITAEEMVSVIYSL
jgi:hypothetical protein